MKKVLSIIVSLAMIATVIVTTISLNSTAAETVESKNPDTTKSCIQAIRDSLTMTWHDEFDGGEDGKTIDHSKWLREGSGKHRNGEVHVNADTDDEHNAWIDDGELVFELRKEDRVDVNGELYHYTADSFYTPAKTDHDIGENDDQTEVGAFLYGMLEARVKFPDAGIENQNTNLAFWTTGINKPEGHTGPYNWPGCGEIDIAEKFASNHNIHSKLHYSPNNDGAHDIALIGNYTTGDTNDPTETNTANHISGFYHTYGVFWTPDFFMYYVDDAITAIYDITSEQYRCLRECPQQMRIGIAGKMFGEKMDEDFTSAQAYYDYVRVYQAVDENGKSVIDADKAREAYSHIKVLSALNDCVNSKSSTDAGNWQPGGTFKQAFFGAGTNYVTFTTKEKFKPDTYQVYSTGVGAYWYTGKAAYNLNGVDIGAFADYSKATTAETPILIKDEETGEFTNAGTRTATYVDDVSTYLGTAQITGDGGHNLKIGVTNKGNGAQAGGWLLQKAFVLVGKSKNLPDVIVNYDTETPITTTTTTTTTTHSGDTSSSTTTTISDGSADCYQITDVSKATNWQSGWWSSDNGALGAWTGSGQRAALNKIVQVEYGTDYTLNLKNATGQLKYVLREYKQDGSFLKSFGIVELGGTYTPSSESVGFVSLTVYDAVNQQDPYTLITNGTIAPSMTVNADTKSFIFSDTYVDISNKDDFKFDTSMAYPCIHSEYNKDLTAGTGVTITTKGTVEPGIYDVTLFTRDASPRALIDISINGVVVAQSLNTTSSSLVANNSHSLKTISIPATTVLTIKVTVAEAGKNVYLNSLTLTKTDDYTTALTTAVATEKGASIRLGDVNGIRFYTTVDEEALATLVGDNDYEIGTIIAPADLLGADNALTAEDNCIIVPYSARTTDGKIKYHNEEKKQIAGSIVNIKEKTETDDNGNIDREFMARAYVKVGDTYYYSATTSTRSLQYVAQKIKDDTTQSAIYEQFKERIDAWSKGEPAPKL